MIDRYHVAVALSAGLLSVLTLHFTGDTGPGGWVFLFVTAATLAAYNIPFLSLGPNTAGRPPSGPRAPHMRVALFVSASAAAVFALLQLPPVTHALIAAVTAVTFGYVMPFRWKGMRLRGLRNVPLLKSVLLAGAWTVGTAAVPIVCAGTHPGDLFRAALLLERFFFILALTIAFDIRDWRKDKLRRIRTLPVVFGIGASKRFAIASLALFVAFGILHRIASGAPGASLPFTAALCASAAIPATLLLRPVRPDRRNQFGLLMDATMIVQFILLWGLAL
jgi:4-hydroxybenzoate polyprenyltransferase